MGDARPVLRHYDANYGNFKTDLYQQIRREAFGIDIGQSSWLTADELDRFAQKLDITDSKILLDVACGSGGPALRVAEITGCAVKGVDVHSDAIVAANSMVAERGLSARAEFLVGDAAARLPFAAASFDAIMCIDAINHLPDRKHMLSEWSRLLKPAARILFTDPITVTGPLTGPEIAIRSSIGFFLFVPIGYDEQVIAKCGFRLIAREDVTENMATVAERRRAARASHESQLREIEGDQTYEGQQEFLLVASRLAAEKRLSRFMYLAEKSGK